MPSALIENKKESPSFSRMTVSKPVMVTYDRAANHN